MVGPKNIRAAGALVASTFLIVLVLLATPAAAVTVERPVVDDGAINVRIHIDDPDKLPESRVKLHFECGPGGADAFTETYELVDGFTASGYHATLHILWDNTTQGEFGYGYGYSYYQGQQSGFGEDGGVHGSPGSTDVVRGPYGYGYGYTQKGDLDGEIVLSFTLIKSAFDIDETCTVVAEVDFGAVLVGDFESPRSTVFTPNSRPVANAGTDQRVAPGATVQLFGLGTDADGDSPLAFSWTQIGGPIVTLSDDGIAGPTFVAPARGAVTLQLEVSDPGGLVSIHTPVSEVTISTVEAEEWFLHRTPTADQPLLQCAPVVGLAPPALPTVDGEQRFMDKHDTAGDAELCPETAVVAARTWYVGVPDTQMVVDDPYESRIDTSIGFVPGARVTGDLHLAFLTPNPVQAPDGAPPAVGTTLDEHLDDGAMLEARLYVDGVLVATHTQAVPEEELLLGLQPPGTSPTFRTFAYGPFTTTGAIPEGSDATLEFWASVGSSRVDLQACKLEYSIVSPK